MVYSNVGQFPRVLFPVVIVSVCPTNTRDELGHGRAKGTSVERGDGQNYMGRGTPL